MTLRLFILLIIIAGQIRSQTNKLPPANDSLEYILKRQGCVAKQQKYETLHFFAYGVPSYYSQCEIDLRKQYGFDEVLKAGCYVKRGQARRYDRHNYRIEKKMEKRHGKDWHKQFDDDVSKCIK